MKGPGHSAKPRKASKGPRPPAQATRARKASETGATRSAAGPARTLALGRSREVAGASPPGARRHAIRRAKRSDLPELLHLETLCFQDWRRSSPKSLRTSLTSPRQSVWVIDLPEGVAGGTGTGAGPLAALLVLWHRKTLVRVYDVATHPALRGQHLGVRLMEHAEELARSEGCAWVQLEADPKEPNLVQWYEAQGYAVVAKLPRFYHGGRDAVRMRKPLRP